MTQLQTTDLDRLRHCEDVIDRTKRAAWEFVRALKEIKDGELWRASPAPDGEAGYVNFDDYCQRNPKLRFTKNYANRLLRGLEVQDAMPIGTELNEAQARELAKVPEEKRKEVYEAAVRDKDGRPTAGAIREAADRLEDEPEEEAEPIHCPNCGNTEVDEDGDCAACREPHVIEATGFGVDIEKDIAKRRKQYDVSADVAKIILGNIVERLK
jgi:predicted RNA-binding Zn-ribbon protein involved in translation (DUF1610 family)